jgi:hypothetical protein
LVSASLLLLENDHDPTVNVMVLDRDEMEEIVQSASAEVLDQMENDKFYNTSEMSELIFRKKLFTRDALGNYVSSQYKDKTNVPPEEVFAAIIPYLRDLAFVEAFLWSHLSAGKLVLGFKNNQAYYARK